MRNKHLLKIADDTAIKEEIGEKPIKSDIIREKNCSLYTCY